MVNRSKQIVSLRSVGWALFLLAASLVSIASTDDEGVQLSQLLLVPGARPGDHYGACVASAGDFDADGMDDLVIGIPGDDTKGENAGAVTVLSGRTGEPLATYFGEGVGDHFGAAVSGATDIAFDGFDRVVVGAPGHDESRGAAYVFGGSKRGLVFKVKGKRSGDQLGFSIADTFDVSSDGVFDVVIGSPGHDGKSGEDCGRAVVISGRSKSKKLRVLHEWDGASPGERFGSAVATLKAAAPGKFNAIAVGAPLAARAEDGVLTGTVRVFSGKSGKLMYELAGMGADDRFGHAITGVGQWRPIDGSGDVAISAGGGAGYVNVYSGMDGALLNAFRPKRGDGQFGWSIGGEVDLDRDGIGELLVGTPVIRGDGADGDVEGTSVVRVFSGKDGSQLAELTGKEPNDAFGISVCGAGYFGADGFAAIAIGVDQEDHGPGYAGVFSTKVE